MRRRTRDPLIKRNPRLTHGRVGVIARLGLSKISAKYPNIDDVYVLEVCKTLGITPEDVTQEQRKFAKAIMYGRLYSLPPERLEMMERAMREGQF